MVGSTTPIIECPDHYTPEERAAFKILLPLCERYLDLLDAKDCEGLHTLYEEAKMTYPVGKKIASLAKSAYQELGGLDKSMGEEESWEQGKGGALYKRYIDLLAAKDSKGLRALYEEARQMSHPGKIQYLAGSACRKLGGFDDLDREKVNQDGVVTGEQKSARESKDIGLNRDGHRRVRLQNEQARPPKRGKGRGKGAADQSKVLAKP